MTAIRNPLQGLSAILFISLLASICMAAAQTLPAPRVIPVPRVITIDIKSKIVVEALSDWARQTGLQLIVPDSRTTEQLIAPAIKGKFTAVAALEKLLAGTPLTYVFINERTVAIRESVKRAMLPQLDLDDLRNPKSDVLFASTSIEQVIVTGSRLRYPKEDIRADGSVDTPAPVTVFNRERIDELGASSVADLMKYVPQQPFKRTAGSSLSGAEHAELRGVGVDATLVLINGRRTMPSANTVSSNAFDLNTIPLVAVERVEILSDSASAVYGTDAIGGVVNIILKQDIPRPVLDLHYGAADGGADERRVALSGGYSNGRFHSLAVLDYFDRGFLLGSDRDRWRNQDYRRFGSVDRRTTISNPGNITSTTLDNLPGLPSRFAAVPTGSTGVGLTPADFLATAGQENKVSLARYSTIVPETDRRSVAVFADFDITSNLNAFGDLLYADRRSNFSQEPSVTVDDAIVPAKNPFNPFGVDVSVDYLPTGPGPNQSHVESNLYRVTAGLRGAFGMWDWELSALRSDEDTKIWVENQLDPARVYAAVSALDRAQALNVFQDGPGGSPALLASLLVDPAESTSKTSSKGTQGAAVIRGQLGTLPAGAVEMVIGGEWIESDILFDDFTFVKHGRTASAAFAELRMPLVSPAMQIPGVKGLSLTLAARQDHYSDFGDTFNPQYGLVWRPVSDLMVRASYGTSFRAPSLFELFAPRQEFSGVQILDPARNSELASVRFITGGNPDLNPTEADSFTAGLVFTPGALKGLQLSSTYWRVRMENGVKILPFYVILANEERFADRVVRGPADTVSGLPGVLQTLDISRVNFGSIETSGVDSGAAYSFDTKVGRFSPSLSATWVADYKVVELPGTPAVDTVGVASLNGTILRWRATATLGWAIRGVGLSATGRYSPGYEDATTSTGPTGRHLSSQVLVDMQGSLDFDEFFSNRSAWLPGLKLTAGVSNLFDKEPNFSEITDVRGFDPAQGDLMQRFAYLKLSATF